MSAANRPAAPVARPDAIRRHNLAQVLGQIHRDGPLTRAQLTERLGLSRSTVGALVTDLAELGLVCESVPAGGPRAGRPSHLVGPSPRGPYAVAVDIDVSRVVTAAVGLSGTVLARHVVPCGPVPPSPPQVAGWIAQSLGPLAKATATGADPVAIGVSVPGTVERDTGTVGLAPNLGWREVPFARLVADACPPGVPVATGNDADLAVLAEQVRGSGRGRDDVIFLMGRIGVGAGIVTNGRPLRGRDGYAGEIGHTVVNASGPACHCGNAGCLETYVGGQALLTLTGSHLPATEDLVHEVFARARAGGGRARTAVQEVATWLGRAVAGLVNTINPEMVILGGTFAEVLDVAPSHLERAVARYALPASGSGLHLCAPGLGLDSALLGAAEIAFAPLLDDPVQVLRQ